MFLFVVSLVPYLYAIIYKIKMAYTFNIPQKYFNINIVEEFFYIIIIGVLLLLYLFCKNIVAKGLLLLIVITSQIIFFLQEEFFLMITICIVLCFIFFILAKIENFLKNKCKEIEKILEKIKKDLNSLKCIIKCLIRTILSFIVSYYFIKFKEYILEKYHYSLFSGYNCLLFFIIIVTGIIIFYLCDTFFHDKGIEESNLKNEYLFLDIMYVLAIVLYIILNMANLLTSELIKKNYEIFYIGKEPKVIITTYEGKYLIMDCDYDKDKVEITNIYRKNYEFIEMTEAKGLQYIESNKVPEIKNFRKMVKINE